MKEVVQVGHKVLRQVAEEVPVEEILSQKIQNILKEMKESLDAEPDGAALAAPQIGLPLRIFILSSKIFGKDSEHSAASKDPHLVYINPVIKKCSGKKKLMDEGCLSVRPLYGKVRRASRVTIEAYAIDGAPITVKGTGLLAQIFQHEYDHLDGVLFIDKATQIRELDYEQSDE
jgi:peptide deformylase